MLYSRTLLFIHSAYNSLHLLTPAFLSILPPMPSPLTTTSLFCTSMILFLFHQFSSVAQSFPTLCDPMGCSTPGFPVHCQLLELAQTHVHRVGDAIQPSHPLLSLLLLPLIFPTIGVFSIESVLCMKWPKYWSFSFSISPPMSIED